MVCRIRDAFPSVRVLTRFSPTACSVLGYVLPLTIEEQQSSHINRKVWPRDITASLAAVTIPAPLITAPFLGSFTMIKYLIHFVFASGTRLASKPVLPLLRSMRVLPTRTSDLGMHIRQKKHFRPVLSRIGLLSQMARIFMHNKNGEPSLLNGSPFGANGVIGSRHSPNIIKALQAVRE